MPAFNSALWAVSIGFAVYSFEGIGIVLPVKEICAVPAQYEKILLAVILCVTLLYSFFGEFMIFAYGENPNVANSFASTGSPLITDSLPPSNPWVWVVKILFCFNLIFSYPLVIFPANMVIESYLYAGWPKSKKR